MLKEVMESNQYGMIAAYVGIVGSVVFVSLGLYFVWKNRRALHNDKKAVDLETEGNDETLMSSHA